MGSKKPRCACGSCQDGGAGALEFLLPAISRTLISYFEASGIVWTQGADRKGVEEAAEAISVDPFIQDALMFIGLCFLSMTHPDDDCRRGGFQAASMSMSIIMSRHEARMREAIGSDNSELLEALIALRKTQAEGGHVAVVAVIDDRDPTVH